MGGLVILGQNPPFPWLQGAARPRFACKFRLPGHGCKPAREGEFGVLLLTFNPCFQQGRAAVVIGCAANRVTRRQLHSYSPAPAGLASLEILRPLLSARGFEHMIYDLV